MDDTESDDEEASRVRDDDQQATQCAPPAGMVESQCRGKGRGRGRGRGRGGHGAENDSGAAGAGSSSSQQGDKLGTARGRGRGRGRGLGNGSRGRVSQDKGPANAGSDRPEGSNVLGKAVQDSSADIEGRLDPVAAAGKEEAGEDKGVRQIRPELAASEEGAKSAKARLVKAFLARFDETRQALRDAEIVEYAKAQRLSEQDVRLLHDAGSWVLEHHYSEVLAAGFDEAAMRKKLQVELRLHMKSNKAAGGSAAAAREGQKLEKQAQEEEKKRKQLETADEKLGAKAMAAEERAARNSAKDSKVSAQAVLSAPENAPQPDSMGVGGKEGEADVRSLRRRSKKAEPMYVEEGSDEGFVDEDGDYDEEDEDVVVRAGKARGRKKGRTASKGGGGESGRQEKRRRENKLVGTVWHGGKDGGGGKGDACDDVPHVTTREEALRQRETVVVKSVVWRSSLLPTCRLGLPRDGSSDGGPERVGLVALRSAKVVTLWAFWRRSAQDGSHTAGAGGNMQGRKEGLAHVLVARSVYMRPVVWCDG